MMDRTHTSDPPDLREWVTPIWRRRWVVLSIVLISTIGTYLLSSLREKRYAGRAQVYVSSSQAQSIVSGTVLPPTDRDTQDQAQLLASRRVTERVIRKLRLRETPEDLVSTITVVPATGSNFVGLTAERASPREAADVANTYVREYITSRRTQLQRDFDVAIKRVQGQLARVPLRDATVQQREDLQLTLRQLQGGRAVAPSQARQTITATPAKQPVSPQPARDALFAMVASSLLALALVVALERFDRRIKRPEDVPDLYEAPLLSTIPHSDSPVLIEGGRATVRYVMREPFRSLRSNIRLASPDKPLRLITVTSAVPGEGKSTIVRNLALTYLEWGLTVVVVEADLRRPTMSQLFGLAPADVGLTSVITGEAHLEEAMVEIAVDFAYLRSLDQVRSMASGPRGHNGNTDAGGDLRLMLLPSGPSPPNPPAVLGADRTRELIDQLEERFDIVLVDTPPLLPVSDAVPFLSHSDGVIIVARIGLTHRQSAQQVMEAINRVPDVEILGVVANDLPSESGGYGYGYGYGYDYGYSATAKE